MGVERFKFQSSSLLISQVWKAGLPPLFLPYFIVQFGIIVGLMQTEDYDYLYLLEESFWWFVGMREISAALLDPLCPPTRNRIILDAGCGTGANLEWLSRYAGQGRIIGIDVI